MPTNAAHNALQESLFFIAKTIVSPPTAYQSILLNMHNKKNLFNINWNKDFIALESNEDHRWENRSILQCLTVDSSTKCTCTHAGYDNFAMDKKECKIVKTISELLKKIPIRKILRPSKLLWT